MIQNKGELIEFSGVQGKRYYNNKSVQRTSCIVDTVYKVNSLLIDMAC